MMRQYELVDKVRAYNPAVNEDLLNAAYVYAMQQHGQQLRASGDPYFSHPLQVASLLTDLRLDDATIAAGLLHDTIEDTDTTRGEIEKRFGKEIAALVEGLTKIKKLDLVSKEAKQAENLRKLLLAIVEDVRVLLVKLADRLHNMRTLHFMSPDKRARIAQETLDIYAPLAGRMGMQDMREELEDLAFHELQPAHYDTIVKRLEGLKRKNGALIAEIERDLAAHLAERGIEAKVKGREKRPYSIFKKTERKQVAFEQLSDIFAFRILVGATEDCYRALGLVHTKWPLVPGRFKDYISTPKQNDYRSLHTTVIGPGQQRVELQIRTDEMHRIAEFGIAAHALYKDNKAGDTARMEAESRAFAWLRRTMDVLAEGDSPEEFLEHTKLELFQDQVFCFTPKGKLITLPRGANAIDFAYAVHTDIGNTAVGCRVNGRPASLVSELFNGDEVAIITVPGQAPPAAWETLVTTGRARAAIRKATKAATRAQYAGLGQRIIERAFERAGKTFSPDALKGALKRLARKSVEDVVTAVGRGEMRSHDVLRAVYPDFKVEQSAHAAAGLDDSWFGLSSEQNVRFKVPGGDPASNAIPIRGINADLPVRFAECGAVPGDRIVGILTPGEAITLYPIQSSALANFDDPHQLWLDVRWDVEASRGERYPARIQVVSINEPGTLAQITQVIAETDANIDNLTMRRFSSDMTELTIDMEVYDLKHLTAIIDGLRARKVISDVQRVL
ncbi:RelA/SpoT family protein [Labrys wisconsinensis]|uniref:RelA/SpoT family protein n=1 Tax=Labrys wisconsinensis TaxID=425677 RepID=UPI0027D88C0A|nr:bifunctional (p)ppGpp synthetase/guanosine-3',5'-bis(diphosphate) 3'-pyrophosphohydrolase [Labrys wisconsinensis]